VRPGRLSALTSAHPRLVSRIVLERLADSSTPQHLLAIARRRDVPVSEILGRPGPVVFVFGIQDPGNLGAIVRVAEAVGGAGVVGAPGTADFFHPRAVRASAGSVLRVPVSGRVSFEPFAADAREAGRPLCGAVAAAGEDPFAAPPSVRSVLVVGSEGVGLPAGAYRYLDRRLTIPMEPPVDSLNAAVATALLLYATRMTAAPAVSAGVPAPPPAAES
jgi:TrmH family RNA methyltransferase